MTQQRGRGSRALAMGALMLMGVAQQAHAQALDDAKEAGLGPDDFPTHTGNAFKGMDSHVGELTEAEIKGRNTWLMWTGGNQAFWDHLARHGNGVIDLLRILDSRVVRRSERFAELGLVPTPGMEERAPDEGETGPYGLKIDGNRKGAYYGPQPNPKVYGYPSGVVGLRLFPRANSRNKQVRKKWEQYKDEWDAEAYVDPDSDYHTDPNVIRPYRVGMSCAFCHVQANPLNPPQDMADPKWENLSSNIGNQYFDFADVFGHGLEKDNLIRYLLGYAKPGTVDTSLIATDGNNNPNTMNSVFLVGSRIGISLKAPAERISESTHAYIPTIDETREFEGAQTVQGIDLAAYGLDAELPKGRNRRTAHVLAGGEDSVGTRGALNRVYVNIGEHHQEWLDHHNTMIGIEEQTPFPIEKAQENSTYWQTSQRRSTNVGKYFLTVSQRMPLRKAPGVGECEGKNPGEPCITKNEETLKRGKEVFARQCVVCHSSKQPKDMEFWKDPTNWQRWVTNPKYRKWAREAVKKEDFLENNYLSTDQRYPVTEIGTNVCRSLNDNSRKGRIWSQFSSDTYKDLSAPDEEMELQHPYNEDETFSWTIPDDAGAGRYRPHSLVAMWATAPYLHNNSVGEYPDGADPAQDEAADLSVEGRMAVFENSVEKLLGLEPRDGYDSIYRVSEDASISVPANVLFDVFDRQSRVLLGHRVPAWVSESIAYTIGILVVLGAGVLLFFGVRRAIKRKRMIVPGILMAVLGLVLIGLVTKITKKTEFEVGHIPEGTPANLVLNITGPGWIKGHPEREELARKLGKMLAKADVKKVDSFTEIDGLVDTLLELNKCPDFVQDRGHQFGWYDTVGLANGEKEPVPEEDRRALIEYLKTL